jgi:nucleoside-diphosphate-sugar epimerase
MTSVLITGGAGYLGSVLTEVLLNKGYRVTVLDNLIYKQTSVAPFAYHSNFNFVLGDVTNESTLKHLGNFLQKFNQTFIVSKKTHRKSNLF